MEARQAARRHGRKGSRVRFLLAAALILPAAASARADTLLLQDGQVLIGPRVEERADGVTVHFAHGAIRIAEREVLARYDRGDPEARIQADAVARRRKWRNRHRVEAPPFRFEATASRRVFQLYRDRLLAYYEALTAELAVERPEGTPRTVSLFGDETSFHQIGGASSGVLAYYAWVRREIAGFDDPLRRGTCLRGLQWATASYVVDVAFPGLPREHPLHGALVDYYGAAKPNDGEPTTFTFGLAVGGLVETLRQDLGQAADAGIARMTEGPQMARRAWSWAVVHLHLQDERRRGSFLAHLRNARTDAPPDLDAVLDLETPADRDALATALRAHVPALEPTTAVDCVAAGRMAEDLDDLPRAASLYRKAVSLAPNDPEALRAAAGIAERRGGIAAAVTAWRAVLAVAPLDLAARESLARCLEASGCTAEGEQQVRLAREIREALASP